MSENVSESNGAGRKLSRATKLVVIGGLASGAAFAAVTGISSAASSSSPSTTAASSSASTTTPATHPGHRGLGGPRGIGGMGPGGGGTVTAINGTTLTLRTEAGTETVDTTSSTTFTKELQNVSLAAVKVGDVVHVGAPRPTSTSTATPGTGTVTATRVDIVEPTISGRVTAVGSGTISLVGPDGQLLTASTTGSTRYYSGTATAASSAVKVGTYIVAEGPQDTLTHVTADVIRVRSSITGGGPGAGFGPVRGAPGGPERGGWEGWGGSAPAGPGSAPASA